MTPRRAPPAATGITNVGPSRTPPSATRSSKTNCSTPSPAPPARASTKRWVWAQKGVSEHRDPHIRALASSRRHLLRELALPHRNDPQRWSVCGAERRQTGATYGEPMRPENRLDATDRTRGHPWAPPTAIGREGVAGRSRASDGL